MREFKFNVGDYVQFKSKSELRSYFNNRRSFLSNPVYESRIINESENVYQVANYQLNPNGEYDLPYRVILKGIPNPKLVIYDSYLEPYIQKNVQPLFGDNTYVE